MKRLANLITAFAAANRLTYHTGAYAKYTYDGSQIKAVEHKNSSDTHDASPVEMDADARSGNIQNIERNEFVRKLWLGRE